jgi:GSCFA family protein
MEFYANKPKDLPRFIYRNLQQALSAPAADRQAAIKTFTSTIDEIQLRGDWLKLKWCLPPRLADELSAEERQQIESVLQAKRGRRNEKFLEVFPHCSDEFSFDVGFLDAAFGAERFDLVSRQTRVFTMGSCFAHNIAEFLMNREFSVTPFAQAEDLNSPFSNAKMLAVCASDEAFQRSYVGHWVKTLYPPHVAEQFPAIIDAEIARLKQLAGMIRDSEFIIITCGNVLDYFLAQPSVAAEPGPRVAPKFFSISNSEDVELRHYLTSQMKTAGAEFRLGSFDETLAALAAQHQALRSLNPEAHLVYTLSPVPIDSAIGAHYSGKMGAIELDCISKSSLRVALAAFFGQRESDSRLHYFPSFEVVRWIAPCVDGAAFGREDAASRHVSQQVLAGVYRYFLHKYCVE